MVAHIVSGGGIVTDLTGASLPTWINTILYVLLFSPVIYFGTLWVDRLNLLLMLGIVITYGLFVGASVSYVTPSFLTRIGQKSGGLFPLFSQLLAIKA